MDKIQKILCGLGVVSLVVIGVVIVPKLLKKCTIEIYKRGNRYIDFDNLGPEIVKKTEGGE